MPMDDDLARYDAARTSQAWVYQWWDRDQFLTDMGALLAELKASPGAVPRCYRGTNEKGLEVLWFVVHDGESRSSHTGFNISHPCPPDCGGGG